MRVVLLDVACTGVRTRKTVNARFNGKKVKSMHGC